MSGRCMNWVGEDETKPCSLTSGHDGEHKAEYVTIPVKKVLWDNVSGGGAILTLTEEDQRKIAEIFGENK